ncbi:MAG: molybdopterin-dependent oxidoreductase [Nitrospirae bacterium]|nr:molybdopterin-dependent oxidoreductase [Nitrospirota bacterium]
MGTRDAKEARLLGAGEEIDLEIDGEKVKATSGRSLYDVLSGMGKIIPAMCYHYTFTPFGSCGMCLVEVEGKKAPVRSCTASVQSGMIVRTETPPLKEAQKKALIKHLSTHPLDCPVCDADGHCELQDFTFQFGIGEVPNVKQKGIPEDTRSIVLDFNMNRCITCGECINICKEVQLVDALTFMKKDGFTIVTAKEDKTLYCEFCGDCLAVCPVGAITNKFSKYLYKPWQMKKTQTTCPYCGDGCPITVETKDNRIVRVTSRLSWKAKWGDRADTAKGHGGICGRGRFGFEMVNSPNRLKLPLVRKNGDLVETHWLDTQDLVAERLTKIKMDHGGQAIAGLISARCTNEDIYLFQKFMRIGLGTNQIDGTARYGHMNVVMALRKAFGTDRIRMMNNSEQVTKADAIFIIGSDITETHPVFNLRVKEALRKHKAKVIVADPITTHIAKLATHPLAIKPGSEPRLIQGLVKIILDRGLCDEAVLQKYPLAVEALQQATAGITIETVADETGIPVERLGEAAEILAKAERGVILFEDGITKRKDGYQNVLNLVDLALVSGLFEKDGSGLNALCEENNELGLVDMGGASEFLPGGFDYQNAEARAKISKDWREELPSPPQAEPSADLARILDRARKGEIKALYIVGENPVGTLPASMGAAEALSKVDLVIVQDPFLTETGRLAHVVLPATTYAEKEGSFTSMEGKVNPVRMAIEPIGESKPDWEIFSELAWRMGFPLEYGSAKEIHREIAKTIPGYFTTKPEPLPIRLSGYLNNGYAKEAFARYDLKPSNGSADYPFTLVLGQILYHSGKYSTQAEGLMKIYDKALLQIGPADAERLGVAAGDKVVLKSPMAAVEVGIEIQPALPSGLVFFPEHFNTPPVKDLIAAEIDSVTRVIYHKRGPVAIMKGAS